MIIYAVICLSFTVSDDEFTLFKEFLLTINIILTKKNVPFPSNLIPSYLSVL